MDGLKKFTQDMKRFSEGFNKLQRNMPIIIGTVAVKHSRGHFKRQGFVSRGSLHRWKKRISGTPRNSRPIMVNQGVLRDSIRYRLQGAGQVFVGVDLRKVPYAKIHNEGGKIPVTKRMRRFFWAMHKKTGQDFWKRMALSRKGHIRIPKRQFLGITSDLDKAIKREIDTRIRNLIQR